ncbi:MAG: Xaa-Pro peptidase family protein [Candidatus Nanohaloarchaea archaeon]
MLEKIRESMDDEDVETLVLTDESNITYALGQKASGYVFITADRVEVIASKFYRYSLQDYEVEYADSRADFRQLLEQKLERMENVAADSLSGTLEEYDVEQTDLVKECRTVKTQEEIQKIREACRVTTENIENLRETLFTGLTEWEAVSQLTEFYAERGVGSSFVTQEGYDLVHRNCLSPHRDPRADTVEEDDLVIVDTGCRNDLYCSDVTRTFCENPSEGQKKLFEDVKDIQASILEMVEPGVELKELDKRMNRMVEEKGYSTEKNVLHLLGHSVGTEVHEKPSIHSESERKLEKNMVMAIEPAIYVEDLGGVRIEDTVLITENGCERLSTPQISL